MPEPLSTLSDLSATRRQVQSAIRDEVRLARDAGHSWQQIADALGMSRQAAWQSFHDLQAQSEPYRHRRREQGK